MPTGPVRISRGSVADLTFTSYRKTAPTWIAGPLNTPVIVETVTGDHLVTEGRVWIGLDSEGFPYPIEDGVMRATYEEAH